MSKDNKLSREDVICKRCFRIYHLCCAQMSQKNYFCRLAGQGFIPGISPKFRMVVKDDYLMEI